VQHELEQRMDDNAGHFWRAEQRPEISIEEMFGSAQS